MSIGEDLLIILGGYSAGYKLMRRRMHGYTGPASFGQLKNNIDAKDNTIRVTLSRLKRNGLLEKDGTEWRLTAKGIKYLRGRMERFLPRASRAAVHDKNTARAQKKKNMVIAFDIPEVHRHKRNWLRGELVALGFVSLQKSVWFGPAPLPRDFINTLIEFNVLPFMKFFEAKEQEIV